MITSQEFLSLEVIEFSGFISSLSRTFTCSEDGICGTENELISLNISYIKLQI